MRSLSVKQTEESVSVPVASELNKQKLMMEAIIAKKKAAKKAAKEAKAKGEMLSAENFQHLRASMSIAEYAASPSRPASPATAMMMSEGAISGVESEDVTKLQKQLKASKKKLKAMSSKLGDVKTKNKKLVEKLTTMKKKSKTSKLKAGMGSSVFEVETTVTSAVSSELEKQRKRMAMALEAAKKRKAAKRLAADEVPEDGGEGEGGPGPRVGRSRAKSMAVRGGGGVHDVTLNLVAIEDGVNCSVGGELGKQREMARKRIEMMKARKRARKQASASER